MAEYRLDDLARLSGVSSRNIRAYRERGLLDPPRRVGRSAYYGDAHLEQLQAISQLLARGFSSAHIAEFFDGLRSGRDLVDDLGIRRIALRPAGFRLPIGPADDDAQALVRRGLAHVMDGEVRLLDPALAAIVEQATDQRGCLRTILRVVTSADPVVDELVDRVTEALADCLITQPEVRCRTLALSVVSGRMADGLDRALAARSQ